MNDDVRAVHDGNHDRFYTSGSEQGLDGPQRFFYISFDLRVSRYGNGHAEAALIAKDLRRVEVPLFEYRMGRDLEEVAQVARARRGVGHPLVRPCTSRSGARRTKLTALQRRRRRRCRSV